jgi:NADH:ubiquinone oxidoreductase subunit 2 (subunit N)
MVAPTPVSAYLHSATMVKAGVYLVARLAPGFAVVAPWRPLVLTVGLATMVVGGWRALRQTDLKRLLAFGTVSQLGFLMVLLGAGTPEAALAGAALGASNGAANGRGGGKAQSREGSGAGGATSLPPAGDDLSELEVPEFVPRSGR